MCLVISMNFTAIFAGPSFPVSFKEAQSRVFLRYFVEAQLGNGTDCWGVGSGVQTFIQKTTQKESCEMIANLEMFTLSQ